MAMNKRLAISSGGQVSVPAAIRRRWGTRTVVLEDRGDHLVLRPAPDDPIEAVRGIFAGEMKGTATVDQLRGGARAEEAELETRSGRRR
jgi:bifunctional DNA-binding transcriptional regulator/antitoxin component of YhaV-PrlF toxin-antitoxin module